jgi:hypothetical protein
MATKYVHDTKAGKSISAYVVLNKKGEHVATIKAHFSDGGTCLVNVHDFNGEFQHATAGGYGYDKFTAALSGMTIDGHKMTNHASSEDAPKPPKGHKLYPRDYQPKKGYSLANYTSISKATGRTVYSNDWYEKAYEALGIADTDADTKNARWEEVKETAFKLQREWEMSDDCETGYSSCFRESGLNYLRAIGYKVIQAI